MPKIEVGNYLVIDPEVYHGELIFKGTRIPVKTVMTFLQLGDSIDDILAGYPNLTKEAVEEVIQMATEALINQLQYKNQEIEKVA
ncbi:DUF433 domain-containing protein [bacterium]|nr:DUF433 domain-containing protein [bacterium]